MQRFRTTMDGYLIATPKIARTGIQLYRGAEVGRPDMAVVRVYRPASEVFAHDACRSYSYLPVTLEHPDAPVTSASWKRHAIGETSNRITRDGDAVRVDCLVRDGAAVKAIKDGAKTQLSVGYTCDLTFQSGVTPDGQPYDAIQKSIRANHLAVVANARGGSTLRIGDRKNRKGYPNDDV